MNYINFDKTDNLFRVDISHELGNIIPEDEIPLKFRVEDWLTSDVYYQCDITPGMWATFDNTSFKNFCLYTKSGKLIKKLPFDVYNDTSTIEEVFNAWVVSRERSRGLVLGAGTGRWGEWLLPVVNNQCNVVLVEGDPNNIEKLVETHRNRINVVVENSVVSETGGEVKFWLAPHSTVSSLDKSVVEKFWPGVDIESVTVQSKTINQIIEEHFDNNLDWIRIDLEGLDHKILMSLEMSIVPNLKMLVFENMNISSTEIEDIVNKLKDFGFNKFINIDIDTICLK